MMKTAVRELKSEDFSATLRPVFDHAVTEIRDGKMELVWDHFLPEWTMWNQLGLARTWELRGAIAGAVFTHDLFSGCPQATLMFWLSTPAARRAGRPIRVLKAFESAAKQFGAKPTVAMHFAVSPPGLREVYQKLGYRISEMIFKKVE
jgi:GNAT superfamily N-acetyltransferase